MSNTKIVIICLIIIMAIFFVALSLNLIDKPNQKLNSRSSKNDQNKIALSLGSDSWVGAMNNLLSPFAPTFKAKDLTLDCPHTQEGFQLTPDQTECLIEIQGFDDEPFKKLSLTPNTRSIQLTITFKPEGEDQENNLTWPSSDFNGDRLEFVVLGDEELKGKTAAIVQLICSNCKQSNRTVKLSFD